MKPLRPSKFRPAGRLAPPRLALSSWTIGGLVAAFLTSLAAAQDPGAAGGAGRRTSKKEPAAAASPRPAEDTNVGRVAVAAAETRAVSPPAAAPSTSAAAAPPQVSETEIVASEGADFESKSRVATFSGAVHVADPRFELWCDKLTVYLNKTTEKGANPLAAGTPAPASTAGEKKDDPGGGGIDRAEANGHVVIIQRRAATEPGGDGQPKVSTGRGEKAVFVNKTGEMTLSGSPRVQQDINEHVATSPGTVMILGRDNTLRTQGPSKTLIRQRPNANEKPPGAPAGGGTVPNRPGGGRG